MYIYYIEKMELYRQILIKLCVIITFCFSIILIIDELYNIGFFTFKYTYLYNYGTFLAKFNNVQTIEYETNRFNLYNNIHFLFKDIYNKSYFNYLLIIVITLLSIIITIAYGIYFHKTFIIDQSEICSIDPKSEEMSFIKQILKCLFGDLHKLIPNCTLNYLIAFIILIIIPFTYIFKLVFSIDLTPNSNTMFLSFFYSIMIIGLLFTYTYYIFNDTKFNDIYEKITPILIHLIATIIFIASGYIYKYFYDKYTNYNLNTYTDKTILFDIYKQTPPIKPKIIEKPIYKNIDLLSTFKYINDGKDPNYDIKKTIMDDYYSSIKNYENDMKYYTQRYNTYNNSTTAKLNDSTSFFEITLNICGLNNKMHLFIIGLLLFAILIYYNTNNSDIIYICIIYLLTFLIIITIINAIQYYNTYVNKYIVYEPLAHYKNDMITANTRLNLSLSAIDTGEKFYKILTNSNTNSNSIIIYNKTSKDIIADIVRLKDMKFYNYTTIETINKDIINLTTEAKSDINNDIDAILYLSTDKATTDTFYKDLISTTIISYIRKDNTNKYNFRPNNLVTIIYGYKSNNNISQTYDLRNYYKYLYYIFIQYLKLINAIKILEKYKYHYIILQQYSLKLSTIVKLLEPYINYEIVNGINNTLLSQIDTNNSTIINTFDVAYIPNLVELIDKLEQNYLINFDAKLLYHSNIVYLESTLTDYQYIFKKKLQYSSTLFTVSDASTQVSNALTTQSGSTTYLTNSITHHIYLTNSINALSSFIAIIQIKLIGLLDITNKNLIPSGSQLQLNSTVNYNYIYISDSTSITIANTNTKFEKYATIAANALVSVQVILNNVFELPLSIIIDNNVSSCVCNIATAKYILINNIGTNQFTSIKINNNVILKISLLSNIYYYTNAANDTTLTIPYNYIGITKNKNNFQNIILAVLYNNLINITSQFKTIELQALISAGNYKSNAIYPVNIPNVLQPDPFATIYSAVFTTIDITGNLSYSNKHFLNNTSITDALNITDGATITPFIVLLYNIYMSNIAYLPNILEYLIYSELDVNAILENNYKYFFTTDAITKNLFKLTSYINKTKSKNEIIEIYEKNSNIISLIFSLYNNLFTFLKTQFKNLNSQLCIVSTDITTIEKTIYNYITSISTKTNAANSAGNTLFLASYYNTFAANLIFATIKNITEKYTNISKHITYFFNIIVFLLQNLDINTNTERSVITENYKFYNTEDYTKSDPIFSRRLTINNDYYSKYNNLDTKQLTYFKINADNVSYNFPILMVIFLVILGGEPLFIKS